MTVWLSYFLRLGEFVRIVDNAFVVAISAIIIAIPIFSIFGFYRPIFRYMGWQAFKTIIQAHIAYGLIFSAVYTAVGLEGVPRTLGIIQPILLFIFIGITRISARQLFGNHLEKNDNIQKKKRVIIYGAGDLGRQLADSMVSNPDMRIIGFLDDNANLHGNVINGITVYEPKSLATISKRLRVDTVLLAMPNLSRKRRLDILNDLQSIRVSVKTLPSVSDLATGLMGISDLKELDIHDLLARQPISPNQELLSRCITQRIVLVTGAGGSIGSELCRQIVALKPEIIILIEQSEYSLYKINEELQEKAGDIHICPILASVRDKQKMSKIMEIWKPDTVYHAAAYKHVPLVEYNVSEGLLNNVIGTLSVSLAAIENSVKHFVLVSTDKAVRPTNAMGASKRLAELILQALSRKNTDVIFSIVRFGNVLDSSGSVVPKFKDQIKIGGPVTITHPEITRYFMTIPEASQLVIQAGAMAKGGEVFVLDMGKPVKIMELAKRMVELSGLTIKNSANPEGDILFEITGLRPGEKLYEELLIEGEPERTLHSRIWRAQEDFIPWDKLASEINTLEKELKLNNIEAARLTISRLVPEYNSVTNVVDIIHSKQFEKNQ